MSVFLCRLSVALLQDRRMEFPLSSPPFHYGLRASGQGEVWSDARPEDKFRQYGWRCGTNEDTYGPKTLIGNWVEQRKDDKYNRILRPLPSQVRGCVAEESQCSRGFYGLPLKMTNTCFFC